MWRKTIVWVAGALLASTSAEALADVPRDPVVRQRTVSSTGELRQIDGRSYLFVVEYVARITTQLVEHGNCGAFSCDLSCTIHGTSPTLVRTLYVSPQGGPTSPQKVIAFKTWQREGDRFDYDGDCNNTDQTHMASFIDRNLGKWETDIANDAPEVENYKSAYSLSDPRFLEGLMRVERAFR